MRFTNINQSFMLNNPYMQMGAIGGARTARAMAKHMVSSIDFSKLGIEDNLSKQLSRINGKVKTLNQNQVKYNDYKLKDILSDSYNKTESLSGLLSTSEALKLNGKNSLFKDSGIVNSNPNVADITSGKRVHGNRPFELKVENIATAQSNAFAAVNDLTGKALSDSGFTIKKGDKSFDFNVSAIDATSNKTMNKLASLNQLAANVNKANIGVKASVEKSDDGKSAIFKLTSTNTGKKNAFTVSNEKGLLNGNAETIRPEDADVMIIYDNGYKKKQTSESNDINIDYSGVKATLKNKGEAKISFDGINKESVKHGINALVENLNKVNESLMENDRKKRVGAADNKFKHMNKELERIGIKYDDNQSKYIVDKVSQDKAMENADLFKENLGGKGKIADQIKNLATSTLRDISRKNINIKTNSFDKDIEQLINKSFKTAKTGNGFNNNWRNMRTLMQMTNSYGFNTNSLFSSPFLNN